MRRQTAMTMLDRAVADIQAVLDVIALINTDVKPVFDDDQPDDRIGEAIKHHVIEITAWAERGRIQAEEYS